MKIIHICLASSFTEGMSYQENLLAEENLKAGHEVTVITNCSLYENGTLIDTNPEDRYLRNGIRLIRIKYKKIIGNFISRKVRKTPDLMPLLNTLKPDVIMFHGLASWELVNICKYKKRNPKVLLFGDSHADNNNSGSNIFSKYFLHKLFYRILIKNTQDCFDKLFYISLEAKDFLIKMYKIPEDNLEFLPLGGKILSINTKLNYRKELNTKFSWTEKDIVLTHSGKMDHKKKTLQLIKNFKKIDNLNLKLLLIGTFNEDIRVQIEELVNSDERIIYLGWKHSDDLIKYIAASDLYVQPGSQSATMQNALCVGTPVLIEDVRSHEPYKKGNAFVIRSTNEMEKIFNEISKNKNVLKKMSNCAYEIAEDILDYKKLAERITLKEAQKLSEKV